ncbi:class II aldolase/adducin family protein [Massilia sp. 9096]|uniref:class II aldolase/adducin family protein n=1 Tax=Massilia sp. 9096 TaxID=1500894 RepID=UPI00068CE2D2|nr:class II aldolase/adducin family protein [Massilia sp. 9096]
MKTSDTAIRAAIVDFCARAGADPLLVQGAGGNVSWKERDVLWIKASGTWLSEAAQEDIFVPVDLAHLRDAVAAGEFSASPKALGDSGLRPSIETMLHSLMPHPVVVHVHAVEVLAHLVRADWLDGLQQALDSSGIAWAGVPYRKPGAELAEAVAQALAGAEASVVFLQNHGVVIGGADIAQVEAALAVLTTALANPLAAAAPAAAAPAELAAGTTTYALLEDAVVQRLATEPALRARLEREWVLYPDHVVFLGPEAYVVADTDALAQAAGAHAPELAFVRDVGVYAAPGFSKAKQVQLRCYADVIVRQAPQHVLHPLGASEIGALLNWDAERYRMSLSK